METLGKDLQYAVRNLMNARGFAAIAIITLALGIGINTAMFSVVNAVLLRPLPYRDPQKLFAIGEYDTRRGDGFDLGSVSYPNMEDIRQRNHSFDGVAAYGDEEA